MADDDPATSDEDAPKKASKLPIIIGLVLFLALGGGGFYAVYSGMVLAGPTDTEMAEKDATEEKEMDALPLPDLAFVPIQPLVINLGPGSANRHLKFSAQLEVEPEALDEVTELLPRVTDVLNGYLRAVDISELEERTALIRLRAQMLRRIQVITGEGRVRDLLIMEFVLN
jgi:flagellar FliL protein